MSATSPSISVVIPTYKRAALVAQAIDSVLAQTRPAAEIIVVDDGSPDNTGEVLAGYGNRIRAIRQPNSGVATARNTGIAAARSEWVSFLDDDDLYAPERLAVASESIARFPDAKVHASNMGVFMLDQAPTDLFELRGLRALEHQPLPAPLIWALKGCYFVQSLVVHRETLNRTGGFRNMLFEDLDLVVRLTRHTPWVVDRRHSVRLMRRDTGLPNLSNDWRNKPVERSEALVRIYRETLAVPGLDAGETAYLRNGLASYLYELGGTLDAAGQRAKARACYAESARTYPALHSKLKSTVARFGGGGLIRRLQKLKAPKNQVLR